jgi:hypothetical protein
MIEVADGFDEGVDLMVDPVDQRPSLVCEPHVDSGKPRDTAFLRSPPAEVHATQTISVEAAIALIDVVFMTTTPAVQAEVTVPTSICS